MCKVSTITSTLSTSTLQGFNDKLGKGKIRFKSKRERRVGENERERKKRGQREGGKKERERRGGGH